MDKPKEFTGVWIPKHILEHEQLKPIDILIYAEIACFDECWHTNTTFAERYGSSEPTISRSINKLIELGFVELVSFNGRNRVVKALFDNPPNQNDKAASSKRLGSRIKMSRQPSHNDPLDNKEITIRKQKVSTAKAEDKISVLYFEVIKVYGLPVRNYDNVRKVIAKMKTEADEESLISYLKFMRDKYADLHFDYKPEINEALDIHAKRKSIISSIQRESNRLMRGKALVI